jgi:hypothetical protein
VTAVDLDARIRNADPAGGVRLPVADPAGARRAMAGPRRRRRVLLRASGLSLAAASTAALAIATLSGGAAVIAPSAAAAALERAGQARLGGQPLQLTPGEYFYSEVRTAGGSYDTFGDGNPAERAYITQFQVIQTWRSADGFDRQIVTYGGPQVFATPASRHAWVLAGEPPIAPPTNVPYSPSFPLGQNEVFGGPGVLPAPDDLSRLPTDPAALASVINANQTGLREINSDPTFPVSPAYTFDTAARILATPAFGSSAALRSALYHVMASVPGTKLLGRATDHSGRRGMAIAGPLGGDGYGQPGGGDGVRDKLIINPSNGAVLEIGAIIASPSLASPEFKRYVGDTPDDLFNWTDYLASGIVASPVATIRPSEGATQ